MNPTLALQVFGGSAHSNIAIEFGFRGVGTTNSNSCASGTVSVGEALRYIRDGFADVVVAGGAEAPLGLLTFGAFAIIKTMSRWEGDPALSCRPFDQLRDGFVMGEGAASLIIEELEHAQARGAHIYAELLGYSLNNDAFHMTSPLPSGESCIRAMREALADARLAPEQIDYMNAHASSTQLNDSTETMAIRQVFGGHANDCRSAEPRVTRASVRRDRRHRSGRWRPRDAELGSADDQLSQAGSGVRFGCRPASWASAKLNYVMSNSLWLRRHQRLHDFGAGARTKNGALASPPDNS